MYLNVSSGNTQIPEKLKCNRCSNYPPEYEKRDKFRHKIQPIEILLNYLIFQHTQEKPNPPKRGIRHWIEDFAFVFHKTERWNDYSFFPPKFKRRRLRGLKNLHCHHNTWALAYQFPQHFKAWTGLAYINFNENWIRHSWLVWKNKVIYETNNYKPKYYIGVEVSDLELKSVWAVDGITPYESICNWPELSHGNVKKELRFFGEVWREKFEWGSKEVQERDLFFRVK